MDDGEPSPEAASTEAASTEAASPEAASTEAVSTEAAITEALRCTGMRETQREMIRAYLDAPPDPTTCCGSSCDPCVITLARAVKRARRALGREDER